MGAVGGHPWYAGFRHTCRRGRRPVVGALFGWCSGTRQPRYRPRFSGRARLQLQPLVEPQPSQM